MNSCHFYIIICNTSLLKFFCFLDKLENLEHIFTFFYPCVKRPWKDTRKTANELSGEVRGTKKNEDAIGIRVSIVVHLLSCV